VDDAVNRIGVVCAIAMKTKRGGDMYRVKQSSRMKLPMILYSSFLHFREQHWRASAFPLNYRHMIYLYAGTQ
jgi:hypothetical protein